MYGETCPRRSPPNAEPSFAETSGKPIPACRALSIIFSSIRITWMSLWTGISRTFSPLSGPDVTVSIDGVPRRPGDRLAEFGEGQGVLALLQVKGVDHLTLSPYAGANHYKEAMRVKSGLGMIRQIHLRVNNPCVLFRYRGAYPGLR